MRTLQRTAAARNTAVLLILIMSLLSMAPPVNASFIPSADSQKALTPDQDLEIISKVLENKIVKQRLNELGYSDQEIRDRLDQLSNQEIHNLALQIDSLNQGGLLGLVISVLVVVILVLVVFRLT